MDHLTYVKQIFGDPLTMRYYPNTRDEKECIYSIHRIQKHHDKFGFGMMSSFLKTTKEFVGHCGFLNQEIDGEVITEIGYLTLRKHWGKGFASEAAMACKEFGFNELNKHQLISLIRPENKASKRVAEKNKMSIWKTIQHKGYVHNVWQVKSN